jgi:hypothetical protein
MKLVGGALNALEILAERARYGLVDGAGRVGVLWHANIDGFSFEIARFAILEARCLGVNRAGVALCLEVPLFARQVSRCRETKGAACRQDEKTS